MIKKIWLHLFKDPKSLLVIIWNYMVPFVSDKLFLRVKFKLLVGYWPDLDNPTSFNEKLNWLKLNDKRDEYTKMVDKIEAKKYVSSIVGEKYIIPTIGVYEKVEDIPWNDFPNQFVVKATSDSGGVVVCKDKSALDVEKAKKKLSKLGGRAYYKTSKEYPYKGVPHRFIAEEYMEDESGYELKDYKIFCSNGKPLFLFIATGRQANDTRFDFFDTEFNHLPFLNGHGNADVCPTKPENFEEMLDVAAKLSIGIPQVRVDLYNVNGRIYFGEMTFFHWSGLVPFEPKEWDFKLGSMIDLSKCPHL